MAFGNVIDELHDDDRLAHASAAERTDLTAFGEGADQINNLDASFKNLRRRILIGERWSRPVNWVPLGGLRSRLVIDRIASDVKYTSENFFANGHGDRSPRISDREAALQTFRRGHGNRADPAVAKVLLHFANEARGLAVEIVVDLQRIVNGRKLAGGGEINVHHGTDDLDDFADITHGKDCWVPGCGLRKRQLGKRAIVKRSSGGPGKTAPPSRLLKRHLGGGDFEEFVGDGSLTQFVVLEAQVFEHLLRIIRGIFHGHHPA